MIVNKIHLENWGIIREPTEVEFSNGLNILYGPNDIGKTTLVDSIRTIFFTKHASHYEHGWDPNWPWVTANHRTTDN